jgi:hypothetical protein
MINECLSAGRQADLTACLWYAMVVEWQIDEGNQTAEVRWMGSLAVAASATSSIVQVRQKSIFLQMIQSHGMVSISP